MLPPLIAVLTANISEFKAKMAEAGAIAEGMSLKSGSAFTRMAGMGKVAFLGIAAVGALAGGILFELAKHAEETGQAAFEMSEKTGLFPHQASAWIAAGAAVGVQQAQMVNGFRFLSRSMEQINLAMEAGKKPPAAMVQVYKDLGVEIFDAHGKLRSLNDVMLDVADSFKAMPDGPEKTALAMRLFGRAGANLIPILNEGRAGIEAYMDKAKKMGAVMSDSQVRAAHEAYLAHQQFNQAVQGLSISIGAMLMPAMTQVYSALSGSVIPAISRAAQFFAANQAAAKALAIVLAGVLLAAIVLVTAATIAWAVATVVATWPILLIIAAIALLGVAIFLLISHWTQLTNFIMSKWTAAVNWVKSTLEALWTAITNFFTKIVSTAEQMWNAFTQKPVYWLTYLVVFAIMKMIELNQQIVSHLAQIVAAGIQGFNRFVQAAQSILPQLPGIFAQWLGQALSRVLSWAGQLASAAVSAVGAMIRAAAGALAGLPGAFYSAGIAAGQGLANGLRAMIGNVASSAANIVSQAISAAKAAAAASSPSRKTMEIGEWMGQGLGLGIAARTGFVKTSMSNVVGAALGVAAGAPGMSFGVVGSVGGLGGGSSVPQQVQLIVNFNGPVATAAVADEVIRRLKAEADKKGWLTMGGVSA